MIKEKEIIEVKKPQEQLKLFNYKKYFDFFSKLYNKKKLPNCILLSGPKGIGKSTFVYHFINYILSHNEESKYSTSDFLINENSKTFINIVNKTHPNFFSLGSLNNNEDIKIESVRILLKFLSTSAFNSGKKLFPLVNIQLFCVAKCSTTTNRLLSRFAYTCIKDIIAPISFLVVPNVIDVNPCFLVYSFTISVLLQVAIFCIITDVPYGGS